MVLHLFLLSDHKCLKVQKSYYILDILHTCWLMYKLKKKWMTLIDDEHTLSNLCGTVIICILLN